MNGQTYPPTDGRSDGPNDPLRDRYKRKTEVIAGAEGWNHWWWQCDLVSFKSWILMIANHEQLLLCYKWNHKKWNEGITCARTKGRRMVLSGGGEDWANENNWIETLLITNEKQLEKSDGDQSQHRLRFRCLLIHRWRWWWWMCINFKSTIKLIFKINDCEKGMWMKEKWKSNEVEEVKWKIRANGIIITNVRKAKEIFKKKWTMQFSRVIIMKHIKQKKKKNYRCN